MDTDQAIDLDWVTFSEEDDDKVCESQRDPHCPNQAVWRWIFIRAAYGWGAPDNAHALVCDRHKELYDADPYSQGCVYRWERL